MSHIYSTYETHSNTIRPFQMIPLLVTELCPKCNGKQAGLCPACLKRLNHYKERQVKIRNSTLLDARLAKSERKASFLKWLKKLTLSALIALDKNSLKGEF